MIQAYTKLTFSGIRVHGRSSHVAETAQQHRRLLASVDGVVPRGRAAVPHGACARVPRARRPQRLVARLVAVQVLRLCWMETGNYMVFKTCCSNVK